MKTLNLIMIALLAVLIFAGMATADNLQVPDETTLDTIGIQDVTIEEPTDYPVIADRTDTGIQGTIEVGTPVMWNETDTPTASVQSDSPSQGVAGAPTAAQINEILNAHQVYRGEIGAPPLVWSTTIAANAQAWSQHQATQNAWEHTPGGTYGENLAWGGPPGSFTWTQMVTMWGDEKSHFIYAPFGNGASNTGNWMDIGHYTQVIWWNTLECGCGMASSATTDYYTCQYNPPGNYNGQYVYPLATSRDRIAVSQGSTWYEDKNGDGYFGTGDHGHAFGAAGWTPVKGDWDADGVVEIGVYQNGVWYLDNDGDGSFDAGDQRCGFGSAGWAPVVGDWNGNGRAEVGVYQNGVWYLDMDNDGRFDAGDAYYPSFGTTLWQPVVGNWDGDAATEIGVFLNGYWYLDNDNDGRYESGEPYYNFGQAYWSPVVGDWNANVRTEVGVYSNGVWYLDMDNDGKFDAGDAHYNFGAFGYYPVVGDWDADARTEVGVYNGATWYRDVSGNGAFGAGDSMSSFGAVGWTGLAGKW